MKYWKVLHRYFRVFAAVFKI